MPVGRCPQKHAEPAHKPFNPGGSSWTWGHHPWRQAPYILTPARLILLPKLAHCSSWVALLPRRKRRKRSNCAVLGGKHAGKDNKVTFCHLSTLMSMVQEVPQARRASSPPVAWCTYEIRNTDCGLAYWESVFPLAHGYVSSICLLTPCSWQM